MGRRRKHEDELQEIHIQLGNLHEGPPTAEGYVEVTQATTRGPVEMRYYAATGRSAAAIRAGVVFVGGAGGGWDTPVRGFLYPRLAGELSAAGIAGLRVKYRMANDLPECILDVLVGIHYLQQHAIEHVGLVGHSFGGAVVIQAAAHSDAVVACAPLSTQTYGADPVGELGPRCALFFGHGTADEILPDRCSKSLFRAAREPKELHLKEGARHGLDEWADELPKMLTDWLVRTFKNTNQPLKG
jgi:pimeloyl-ACP methyl ester carboxylesterase